MTVTRPGRTAIVEQLVADGVRYVFGNPGTVEQGLLDALEQVEAPRYILTLHETVAVGIADGYARATRRPTIVQLHSGVGLGNGIGMIYQAWRGNAPLVVLAGEAGLRYDAMDAQMAADLVSMARPVTKWAGRVVHPSSLLRLLRRAMKLAATPPMGPVFLALPADVLDEPNDEEVIPTSFPITRTFPDVSVVKRAAAGLAAAERPLILAGDGVAASGAQDELASVAQLLGAEVWGANWSEVNMDQTSPLFRGCTGHMFGTVSRPILSQADAVLICGTTVLPEVFPALEGVFAPGAFVIHLDLNAYEIAKNFPVDLGIVGDPKATLGVLAARLRTSMTAQQRIAARRRVTELPAKDTDVTPSAEPRALGEDDASLHAGMFAAELARQLPKDVVIFDEALTTSPALTRYLQPSRPASYFVTRGGSLGVGLPGAIGLRLAFPDRTVVGFAGDGGSMFTFQALWTAARYDVNAKFVICNNRSYRILKDNIRVYWDELGLAAHAFPDSFELDRPEIDFEGMARALGVAALRVDRPDAVQPAIEKALSHPGPFLLDLVIPK